ncbi:MAG TPA: transposase family protein [Gemmataceae bacterium]|nr:transposase family protein [Gemmataceae bacterium]
MIPPVRPAAAQVEETVVRHLQTQLERAAQAQSPVRRGPAHQRGERQQEQAARRHAVEVGYQLVDQGFAWNETANLLNLTPRTLRSWRQEASLNLSAPAPMLGRPVLRSSREQRNEVIRLIDEVGPAIGVPALREAFPELLRAELADLLARYRRVWRKRHQEPLRVLHWHSVGRVWAIDFTGPLAAIEGRYRYLLAVRDLASGQQLLWQPCAEATAEVATAALAELFREHGAPLVLKSDNGSTFTAGTVVDLIKEFMAELLFSPPGWPRYNGAIEAGIGSLKTRTAASARRHGRPGYWTLDDVAQAQSEANGTARPHGPNGPTPEELWAQRHLITQEERTLFQAEVERQRQEIDVQGGPETNPETDLSNRARERQTIRRALEGLGYLTYTRRRIPLPIRKKKTAIIT